MTEFGDRIQRYETAYWRRMGVASLVAVGLHTMLLVGLQRSPRWRSLEDERLRIGYEGPTRIQPELEVMMPNSVQAHFSQLAREGRTSALEYRVVQMIELSPGPDPMPVVEKRAETEAKPSVQTESEIEIEPLIATHTELSYSDDFVILRLVKPIYPEYELERGISASITVAAWLTPEGVLRDERITQASATPPTASTRGFEIASLEAVRQWKLRPPKRHEESGGMWLTIPIRFDPEDDTFVVPQGVQAR
jgi:TonB family protein